MEAISLLLEVSQAQENDDYVVDYAARMGAKPLVSPNNTADIEAVDAILNLRGDSFDSTAAARWQDNFNRYAPANYSEELNVGRRRRAMSEPWMTMSSPNLSNAPLGELSSPSKRPVPFHPALLQPRFPQPLMALLPSQPHAPGMPHRMPTIDEFASICNRNGRIGVYTKEEREVLIRRFREKKKRRIWKKKIRYECRKDLADRRTRVKGRFVKAAVPPPQTSAAASTTAAAAGTNSNGNMKPPRRNKKTGIVLTMQETPGSLSSSDNTSEETISSVDSGNNDKLQPPLTFHLPMKKASKAVKPLHLEQFNNAEDRLKYLASILGGEISDSVSPGDEDEEYDEDEEDEEEEEDQEEEDGDQEGEDTNANGNKNTMDVVVTEPSQRRTSLRKRSGSEMDYRRPRRHSIAY